MKIFSSSRWTTINDIRLITFLSILLLILIVLAPVFSLFLLFLYTAVVFTMKASSKKSTHTPNTNRRTICCHIFQSPKTDAPSNTHNVNLHPNLEGPSLPASSLNSTGQRSRIYVKATDIGHALSRTLSVLDQLIRYLSSCPSIVLEITGLFS